MISEREKLEFESLPEFVREPRTSTRDSYSPRVAPPVEEPELTLPKTAELEALWPGVSHDFLNSPRKGASFYLTIGFMAGAVVSLIGVYGISAFTHVTANNTSKKEIVVARGAQSTTSSAASAGGAVVTTVVPDGDPEIIVPLASTYEVGNGDTLAAIALKNYRRATPRLLDEICRANGMRNANVLNLGQKIALPEYRPQRIATGGNSVQQ